MSARTTALSALIACRKQNAWSDGVLKEYIVRDRLDRRDAALASRLCYGVMQNRMLLDFYISSFLKGKLSVLQPVVLDILRLGAYQLTMMDKIPASAAVNESVEMCKKYANRQAAGLVNGVLRSMGRAETLPEPKDLATKYSHSKALVSLLRDNVGEELLEDLLKSHNEAPKTALQINPLLGEYDAVWQELEQYGTEPEKHPWLTGCILVSGTGNLESLPCFREGRVCVQDPAARLAVMAAAPQPGQRVLDTCAAPGGKSFAAAMQMENRGEIISCDIHEHKMKIIENGAARLGVGIISAQVQDGRAFRPEWDGTFDTVICDVPCSGLGVIRKKPDIRYKDLKALEGLPAIQQDILENASRYVKPGGTLLYSTCTILKRENEDVPTAFLQKHSDFYTDDFSFTDEITSKDGMLTLLPPVHGTDGFFICKLRKKV